MDLQGQTDQPFGILIGVTRVAKDHEVAGFQRLGCGLDLPDQIRSALIEPVKISASAELHARSANPKDNAGFGWVESEADSRHAEKVLICRAAQGGFESVHIILVGILKHDPPFQARPRRLLKTH